MVLHTLIIQAEGLGELIVIRWPFSLYPDDPDPVLSTLGTTKKVPE
jgi:hypothetical protein